MGDNDGDVCVCVCVVGVLKYCELNSRAPHSS